MRGQEGGGGADKVYRRRDRERKGTVGAGNNGGKGMCCADSEDGGGADGRRTATPGPRVEPGRGGPYGAGPQHTIPNARDGEKHHTVIALRATKGGRAREGSSLPMFEARRR